MQALSQLKSSDTGARFSSTFLYEKNSLSVDAWIIDSGASDHIVCNEYLFPHVHKNTQSPITMRLPNGNITYVTKISTVHLC